MRSSDQVAPDKPLFVRLPAREAERLDRAAFEGGVSKRELVTEMVRRFLDVMQTAEREPLVVVGSRDPVVGRHSFRPDPAPDVLTLEQAAELLQVEPTALAGLAERGEVPARHIGEVWRFSRDALLAWLGG